MNEDKDKRIAGLEAEVARLKGHNRIAMDANHNLLSELVSLRGIEARLRDDCMAEAIALMGKGIGFYRAAVLGDEGEKDE